MRLWYRLLLLTPASCGPGKDSRLSCLFSTVLCTHARSTLPRPWVRELFIAHQQARGCASIASSQAKRPGMLGCWEVGLLQGRGWSYQRERTRMQERGKLPTEAFTSQSLTALLWGLVGNGKVPSKPPMRKSGHSHRSRNLNSCGAYVQQTLSAPSPPALGANYRYLISQTRQVRARVRAWSHPARGREKTVSRPVQRKVPFPHQHSGNRLLWKGLPLGKERACGTLPQRGVP